MKLAIICPVYNERDNISRTVESLLNQSSQDFFCFFVDSGSTDDTITALGTLPVDRFAVFCFENNLGISQNWARALRKALESAEFSHVMFLGGDDALGYGFVQSANEILSDSADSEVTVVPKFVRIGKRGEHSRVIKANLHLDRVTLMSNWSVAHLCYSLVSRKFAETKYLHLLDTGAPNFDWWATYEIMGYKTEYADQLEYFKFEKGMDYESDYYFGNKSLKHRFLSNVPALVAPFAEALALFEAGRFSLDAMSKMERLQFKFGLIVGRYVEAIRRFSSGRLRP